MEIIKFIANVQNISNLIGREEKNIGRTVLSISTLSSLTKKRNISMAGKNGKLLTKSKSITDY